MRWGAWILRGMLLISAGAALLAAAQLKNFEEKERGFQARMQALESAAAAEPVLLGIDTRIRAARELGRARPEEAKALLARAEEASYSIRDAGLLAYLQLRIVQLLVLLDGDEALRLAARMTPRAKVGTERDYKGEAYEAITSHWMNRDRRRCVEAALEGFLGGAFRNRPAGSLMGMLAREDPAAAQAIYARMLAGYPGEEANWQDVWFLMEATKGIAALDANLAREGAAVALASIEERKFAVREFSYIERRAGMERTFQEPGGALLLQLRRLLRLLPPTVAAQFKDRVARLERRYPEEISFPQGISLDPAPQVQLQWGAGNPEYPEITWEEAAAPEGDEGEPDTPEKKAFARARQLLALLDQPQRGERGRQALLDEVMQSGARVSPGGPRIEVFRRVVMAAEAAADRETAAAAARQLAESTAAWCRCADQQCPGGGGRPECLALYQQIMQDLRGAIQKWPTAFQVDASIRSRMLLPGLLEGGGGGAEAGPGTPAQGLPPAPAVP